MAFLQANKLGCYNLLMLPEDMATPESEKKDFSTQGTANRVSIMFTSVPLDLPTRTTGVAGWPTLDLHHPGEPHAWEALIIYNWLHTNLAQFSLKGDIFFVILDSKQTCPWLWREPLSLSSNNICYTKISERIVQNKGNQFLCSQNILKCNRLVENCLPAVIY